jgi:hypothetical protein
MKPSQRVCVCVCTCVCVRVCGTVCKIFNEYLQCFILQANWKEEKRESVGECPAGVRVAPGVTVDTKHSPPPLTYIYMIMFSLLGSPIVVVLSIK